LFPPNPHPPNKGGGGGAGGVFVKEEKSFPHQKGGVGGGGGGPSHSKPGYLQEDKFPCPCQESKQESSVVRAIALSLFGICKTVAIFSRRSEFILMRTVDRITQQ